MEEEEESEAGDTEPDTEELALLDEQLERRGGAPGTGGGSSGGLGGSRPGSLAPQHLQWALRQRDTTGRPHTSSAGEIAGLHHRRESMSSPPLLFYSLAALCDERSCCCRAVDPRWVAENYADFVWVMRKQKGRANSEFSLRSEYEANN